MCIPLILRVQLRQQTCRRVFLSLLSTRFCSKNNYWNFGTKFHIWGWTTQEKFAKRLNRIKSRETNRGPRHWKGSCPLMCNGGCLTWTTFLWWYVGKAKSVNFQTQRIPGANFIHAPESHFPRLSHEPCQYMKSTNKGNNVPLSESTHINIADSNSVEIHQCRGEEPCLRSRTRNLVISLETSEFATNSSELILVTPATLPKVWASWTALEKSVPRVDHVGKMCYTSRCGRNSTVWIRCTEWKWKFSK